MDTVLCESKWDPHPKGSNNQYHFRIPLYHTTPNRIKKRCNTGMIPVNVPHWRGAYFLKSTNKLRKRLSMQLPLGVPVASGGTPIRLDACASGSIMPAPLLIDGTGSRALGANSAPRQVGLCFWDDAPGAASEEEARTSAVRPCPMPMRSRGAALSGELL